jgi:hypothetical protein
MGSFKVLYDYPNFASLPAVGEVSKLYITNNNNTLYRWVDGAYAFFTTTSVPWGNIAGTITNQADLMALINARELAITSGTTAQYWRGDKTFQTLNTAVVPESGNLYYTQGRFDSALAAKSTTNLAEGSNLYYTQARFNSALAAKSTSDLAEGSNLYYTDGRFDTRLATKSTSNLAEGSNLYYTQGRFDSAFTAKDSDDLNEGVTNFYYTSNRFNADFNSKNTDSLAEGISNVYFTAGRARNAISLTTIGSGGSATYNSTTGELNIPTYEDNLVDPLTGAGSAGYLGKYTGSTSVGVSQIFDNGVYVGVNRTNPFYTLDINGTLNVEQASIFRALAGSGDRVVYVDSTGQITPATIGTGLSLASGVLTATGTGSGSIGGTGTSNFVPKFSGTSSIANSTIQDSGSLITLGSNTTISTGGLGIGTSALTQISLRIGKNITGNASSYAVRADGVIQSDATTLAGMFYSFPTTAAASYTVTTLTHFGATQGTFGAGSVVTNQVGFDATSALISATNNYGFRGQITSGTNRWNLYMNGTAQNFFNGATVIGNSGTTYGGTGAILTVTLTNGGSGYVDGTYTNVAGSNPSGQGASSIFTAVVSGGIVTTLTLVWGGVNFFAGDTLTIANSLLGGSGSGLVITVATAETDVLKLQGATNATRLTLQNNAQTITIGDEIGAIRFNHRDTSVGASGTNAYIQAVCAGTTGYGADIVFGVKSTALYALPTEAMRLRSNGALLIGSSTQLNAGNKLEVTGSTLLNGNLAIGTNPATNTSLYITSNITGSTTSYGTYSLGTIQSDVTTATYYFRSLASTAATSFSLNQIGHYYATQGTFGAGSTVGTQIGFWAASSLVGASTNWGFRSQLPVSGANNWNFYADGTAPNYMAGSLGIGTTSLTGYAVRNTKAITGATTSFGIAIDGTIQSDVTSVAIYNAISIQTAAASFTLSDVIGYNVSQSTIGAGSTITNQYGFSVASTLIGATNNFAYRGLIPSGTNRWNLYMGGTAQNYLAGALSIGVTTANASALLQVDSTSQGVLFPRMTTTQKNAIASPAVGLIIYDTTLNKLCVYTGAWQTITSA